MDGGDITSKKQGKIPKEYFKPENSKSEALNTQIEKLETALDRLNKKEKSIINKALSKRESISKKIDLLGMLPLGIGTVLGIIVFGIITKEIGIMLEYISVTCISISAIMVAKMVIEMAIDNYIMEKVTKTDEYISIESLSKKVEKTLEKIKAKKDILAQTRGIEVGAYNDKVQKLYEEGCTPADTVGKIEATTESFGAATNSKSKPMGRVRKRR